MTSARRGSRTVGLSRHERRDATVKASDIEMIDGGFGWESFVLYECLLVSGLGFDLSAHFKKHSRGIDRNVGAHALVGRVIGVALDYLVEYDLRLSHRHDGLIEPTQIAKEAGEVR